MKAFLIKYRRTIIFWMVLLAIVLFFVPRQDDFYLDNDIKAFKASYLGPILLWTGIATSVVIFVWVLFNGNSLKQSAIALLSAGVTIAFFFFIFQDVFLGFSLFINRQVKRGSLQKIYVANYLAGTNRTKDNFFPYDVSTKHFVTDKKLIDKIYSPGLKQKDTVRVTFEEGLFGIAFQPESLADK